MARSCNKSGSEVRVGDCLSMGALFRTYPVGRVKSLLRRSGKASIRERSLPNHVVVYYVLMLALFMTDGYREVMRRLLEGFKLMRKVRAGAVKLVGTSGISQARSRVGSEPFRQLYKEFVSPVATRKTKGAWYKGLLLVSLDGSSLDVADTPENDKAFGRQEGSRGRSAFPKLRFVSLIESGTRVLFGAVCGPYGGRKSTSEMDLAWEVIKALKKGMLCLADRYYVGFQFWQAAAATGSQLLWRAKRDLILVPERWLPDGSYLSKLYPSPYDRKKDRNGIVVRVIEYKFKWSREKEPYIRLITTLLDSGKYPAEELAAVYHERWEIETALGEVKTTMRGSGIVLRSRTPDLVRQEFYGFLLAYFAVRGIMHEAALEADEDPDRLSFLHAVRVIRRKIPAFGIFSRRHWTAIHKAIITEILQERAEPKRHRRNHRGVKRKMSNYHIADRSQDRRWRADPSTIIKIIHPVQMKRRA